MAGKQKILIVDDKLENLVVLEKVLEDLDVEVIGARSGNAALAKTLDHKFSMAILDVAMPGMDGYELAGHLRGDADMQLMPIIFVTASYADERDEFAGYEAGGIDFIEKPYSPAILLTKVSMFLEMDRARGDLEEANLRLQQIGEAKSRFLSSMSHELRTPMNAVLGFTDLLRGKNFGDLNEKQEHYLRLINQSGQHLLSLINDLLDMAKIDAGAMEVNWEMFPAEEVVDAMIQMMSAQFRKKSINVIKEIDESFIVVRGETGKCRQILLNLMSNAQKFTDEGGEVTIGISKVDRDYAKFYISDTGIGINEKDREKIFSEFFQSQQTQDANAEGSGIGLALTRRLVDLHGGEIGVDSKPGKGSTFWFTLPLGEVDDEDSSSEESGSHSRLTSVNKREMHILIAEDNDLNLSMMLDMLSIRSYKVSVAHNGQEAVDLVQTLHPDVVLMDIRMPIMDGIEATKQIRSIKEFEDLPIIALSASVAAKEQEEQIAAGCTLHLSKPIQTKLLFETLDQYETSREHG